MSRIGSAVQRSVSLVIAGLALSVPATGQTQQDGPSLSVGTIDSAKTCTIYREYAGKSAAVITPYAAAAFTSWRSWLVKDCVDNFASLRTSLQAALAAAGGVRPRVTGGSYVISGRISDVSGGPTAAPEAPDDQDFAVSTNRMLVNMDVTVRDRAGRIVFGGLLTKSVETGHDIKVDGFRTTGNDSGRALYTTLQHEVALAVARLVAFHFTPLRLTNVSGKQAQLNYGAPLLRLGTIVQAISPSGETVRYRVTAAGSGVASAMLEGDGDVNQLAPGNPATVIEADDPSANGRRFKKVDLP